MTDRFRTWRATLRNGVQVVLRFHAGGAIGRADLLRLRQDVVDAVPCELREAKRTPAPIDDEAEDL